MRPIRIAGLIPVLVAAFLFVAALPVHAAPPCLAVTQPTASSFVRPGLKEEVHEMAAVRAKFKCTKIERTESSRQKLDEAGKQVKNEVGHPVYEPCEMQTVHLSPVYGNGDPNHENTKFWQSSPSGTVQLGCINLEAARQFELGKEYYLDFTPAG